MPISLAATRLYPEAQEASNWLCNQTRYSDLLIKGASMYIMQHSDWNDELYGWQVIKAGEVIDTYEDKDMAIAYVNYMNERKQQKNEQR